uniref:Uncharacterized protein n=1 Tax=Picea sitchensis TaxID=3332 RepID=A9NMC6_PICSI|nr:unknown [Picea sitchensis]
MLAFLKIQATLPLSNLLRGVHLMALEVKCCWLLKRMGHLN